MMKASWPNVSHAKSGATTNSHNIILYEKQIEIDFLTIVHVYSFFKYYKHNVTTELTSF